MISIQQMQLNIVRAYIEFIKDLYSDNLAEADRLLLVLKIYKFHLIKYTERKPATFSWLITLKTGVREAGRLLEEIFENEPLRAQGWYMGCKAQNPAQHLANLLSELVLELTKEIMANEALYPELKFAFDRERARYAKMKFDAEEAERLE